MMVCIIQTRDFEISNYGVQIIGYRIERLEVHCDLSVLIPQFEEVILQSITPDYICTVGC